MAGMCYGFLGDADAAPLHRRHQIQRLKSGDDASSPPTDNCMNRRKFEPLVSPTRSFEAESEGTNGESESFHAENRPSISSSASDSEDGRNHAKFGMTSVCGGRRNMEDTVSIRPYFLIQGSGSHFYGVYDGHGCSHVAVKCRDRLHEIVKEELERSQEAETSWRGAMERSFLCLDQEIHDLSAAAADPACRCELQASRSAAVGSTAVVAVVTPDRIVVANCGDSRAVLCRNGVAIPLSSDHKLDREDEVRRIQAAGGRVIEWDVPRVFGVLAMSRAIGDDALKPCVIAEPEVTVTDREAGDEFVVLASDGLWDVVDNDTVCSVAGMCFRTKGSPSPIGRGGGAASEGSDKACSDASAVLAKLALARDSTDNVSVVVVDLRRRRL